MVSSLGALSTTLNQDRDTNERKHNLETRARHVRCRRSSTKPIALSGLCVLVSLQWECTVGRADLHLQHQCQSD